MAEQFDVKLVDEVKYCSPPPECCEKAHVRNVDAENREFLKDPEAFWARIEKEMHRFRPWEVLDRNYQYNMWFMNEYPNITNNCLNWHVFNHRRIMVAPGANEPVVLENVIDFKKHTEG